MRKQGTTQKFPAGWNEKRVRDVIAYYDQQTDEEGAAEIEKAPAVSGETWLAVPTALVPAIVRLIEDHAQKAGNGRSRNRKAPSKAPRLNRR